MDKRIEYELIDTDTQTADYETPPDSFLRECDRYWRQYWKGRERAFTDADKAFYGVDEDGQEYFYIGSTRIRITEHFPENGADMGELMAKMIRSAARQQDNGADYPE